VTREAEYDVMVIGAGFAGMAAALFASARGLRVVQAGSTGGIDFSTGFLDLMGVHPVEEGRRWMNPWEAIKAVVRDCPAHPYGLLDHDDIVRSINEFTTFLADQGLEYVGHDERNTCVMTPVGTVKRTYRLPRTAWNGAVALERRAPTLIVDFHGLKGFSARQLVETRRESWPGLRAARVEFPAVKGELYPEHMAWALADPANRVTLAETVMARAGDAEYIGFPAVLGLYDPLKVFAHLEALTGRKLFEIPTMPPSIAGPRLRAVFDRGLPPRGVRTLSQKMVRQVETTDNGLLRFSVGQGAALVSVTAGAAILATGRFFGKGLRADRRGMSEPVFDIPVVQPDGRDQWHGPEFFAAPGHPANRAGIEVDARLRPLRDGGPVHERLFAAGAILAHHDWMRMKCGAGLAIATAYKAVRELIG
jgi:glycerol-3-phosphate dehydrogenase subunit B